MPPSRCTRRDLLRAGLVPTAAEVVARLVRESEDVLTGMAAMVR